MRSGLALFAFALASTMPSLGCADDFMLERTVGNIEKMRSFRGTLVEHGVLGSSEMRSAVVYRKPNDFVSRVVAPDSYAGVTLAYTGSTLTIYYPKSHYAIAFSNLHVPTAEESRALLVHAYKHANANWKATLGDSGRVAKLPVIELASRPLIADALHPPTTTQVYDKFSFPLAGTLKFKDATYSYRYDDIAFNVTIHDPELMLPLPPDTIVARWDLAAPALTDAEMHAQAGFDYALPKLAPRFTEERIVRQVGPVPAFTIVYRDGAEQVLLSLFRDPGIRPASEEHGVPVTLGEKHGHLVIGPTMSSYTFTLRGTMYVLTANMPYDELLQMASTIS